jgi:hypothetical protein
MRAPALLLAALLSPAWHCAVLPLPRAHQHQQFTLPLRGGGDSANPQRLLLVAEAGHGVARSARSLCAQVGAAFQLEGHLTPAQCTAGVAHSLRAARGLAAQHEPAVAAGVGALESYLGEEGLAEEDWAGASGMWTHPYKARFLRALVARAAAAAEAELAGAQAGAGSGGGGGGGGEAEVNVCSVGFGSGHSALIALTGAAPGVRVFSFDRATGRAAIPAQDFLDARFPERNMLFLGDPPAALERFLVAFPATKCAVLLVEPNALQPLLGNATAQALRGLQALAAPDHVLVLVSPLALPPPPLPPSARAPQHSRRAAAAAAAAAGGAAPPGVAWEQAEAAGWVHWEGTLLAAPEAPEGDRVLYGAFTLGAAEAMRARLPIEVA